MADAWFTAQFVTEPSFGSWAIRYGTHSLFSHVDIVWRENMLYGARSDGGVRLRHSNYGTFTRQVRVAIPISFEQDRAMQNFLIAQRHKPYDWKAIVAFATDRDWRDPARWFCSELWAGAVEAGDVLKVGELVNKVSPNDAYLLACAVPGAIVTVIR